MFIYNNRIEDYNKLLVFDIVLRKSCQIKFLPIKPSCFHIQVDYEQ